MTKSSQKKLSFPFFFKGWEMKKSIVITRIHKLAVFVLVTPLFLKLRPLTSSLFSTLSKKIL